MWAKIKRLFSKQSRREIFRYFDGESMRSKDPVLIEWAIDDHPIFDAEKHPVLMEADGQAGRDAAQICHDAIVEIFDLKVFDEKTGKGLVFLEVIETLGQFYDWCGVQKKNTSNSATSLGSTESTLTSLENETTKPTSASPSTSDDRSSETPTE